MNWTPNSTVLTVVLALGACNGSGGGSADTGDTATSTEGSSSSSSSSSDSTTSAGSSTSGPADGSSSAGPTDDGPPSDSSGDLPSLDPVAVDDVYVALANAANITVDADEGLLVNDQYVDPASLSLTIDAVTTLGGTIVDNGNGGFEYVPPPPPLWGVDSFQYELSDGTQPAVGTVSILIRPVEVDLGDVAAGYNGFRVPRIGSGAWDIVAGLGDVNGDGLGDFGMCARGGDALVVFGRPWTDGDGALGLINTANPGAAGFRIVSEPGFPAAFCWGRKPGPDDGEGPYDDTSRRFAAAGDVNGDGFADILLSAQGPGVTANFGFTSGRVYVVYGSASAQDVDLEELANDDTNTLGFTVTSPSLPNATYSIAFAATVGPVGDINGDTYDDVAFSVELSGDFDNNVNTGQNGRDNACPVVVIYGEAAPVSTTMQSTGGPAPHLTAPQTDFIDVSGAEQPIVFGEQGPNSCYTDNPVYSSNNLGGVSTIAPAGDVNGDGLDDVLLGLHGIDARGWSDGRQNAAVVVFGPAQGGVVVPGPQQRIVKGCGEIASGGGHINDDGYADILLASGREVNFPLIAYPSTVLGVYGGPDDSVVTNVRCGDPPGVGGFSIETGTVINDLSGGMDVDGDGVADIVYSQETVPTTAGRTHVVLGRPGMGVLSREWNLPFDDAERTRQGFVIDGESGADSGAAARVVPDLNGDGRADVLVSSPSEGTYVLFGPRGAFECAESERCEWSGTRRTCLGTSGNCSLFCGEGIDCPNEMSCQPVGQLGGICQYDLAGGAGSSDPAYGRPPDCGPQDAVVVTDETHGACAPPCDGGCPLGASGSALQGCAAIGVGSQALCGI